MEKFTDRGQAGRFLAHQLNAYAHHSDAIVLALPRGGVPVAFEIAVHLALALDVFVVRKLGVPYHKELAMGAIASGDIVLLDEKLIHQLKLKKTEVNATIAEEKKELARRETLYHSRTVPLLKGKEVLLVDDGIATGFTMKAAITAIRKQKPAKIIVAAPVAALDTYEKLVPLVDDIICPLTPLHFQAVGLWYDNFSQTSDEEVCALLRKNMLVNHRAD